MLDKMEKLDLRNEEVEEILNRVPHWMIRWGNTLFLLLILLVLSMSWFIAYPEIIQTEAYLTTTNPAQKISAHITGRIDSMFVNNDEYVFRGENLALIENTAKFEDVQKLKNILDSVEVSNVNFKIPLGNLPILFLGEIDQDFAIFENNLVQYSINKNLRPFSNETNAQRLKLNELKIQLRNLESQSDINEKELALLNNDLERSELLFSKGVIAKREFEEKQIEFLQSKRNYEGIISLRSQLRDAINSTNIESKVTQINRTRENISLHKELIQSYNQLRKSIKDWEYKYLLTTQQNGKVSFMNYWNKNQNVELGDDVFTIIPENNNKFIAKLISPSRNAGKIRLGQSVNVNLENYPEAEFGNLKGVISGISSIPNKDKKYLIDVELPDSLKTSYGYKIDYKPEMPGTAEIITEDLRLIQRFFYQFKSLIDR